MFTNNVVKNLFYKCAVYDIVQNGDLKIVFQPPLMFVIIDNVHCEK